MHEQCNSLLPKHSSKWQPHLLQALGQFFKPLLTGLVFHLIRIFFVSTATFFLHGVGFLINQTSTHFRAYKTYAIVPFTVRYECERFFLPFALVILLLKVIPFNSPGNVHFDFSLLCKKLFITRNSLCSCIQVALQSDLYFLCQSEQWTVKTYNSQNAADNRGKEHRGNCFLAMTIFSLDLKDKIWLQFSIILSEVPWKVMSELLVQSIVWAFPHFSETNRRCFTWWNCNHVISYIYLDSPVLKNSGFEHWWIKVNIWNCYE